MVAVFVLPVVLAKLALENDWFNKASTNKGALLEPTINLTTLLEDSSPTWRLLYVMPRSAIRAVKMHFSVLIKCG